MFKLLNPFNNKESDNKVLYTIKILLKTLVVYIVGLILSGILVTLLAPLFGYDPSFEGVDYNIMFLFKCYGYIAMIITFLVFTKKFSKMKLADIGINKNIKSFFVGFLISILLLCLIIGILLLTGDIKFIGVNKDANYLMIILFIGAFLVQSAEEEVICRGYLLNKLNKKLSVFLSIAVSLVPFAVLHFYELFNDGVLLGMVGVINLVLMSTTLCLFVLNSKNIYGALGFHFFWNYALYNIIGLNLSGIEANCSIFNFTSNNSFLTGMSYGIEGSVITTILLLITLFITIKKSKIKD